jgi:polysaccharide deacetylase family protein (PEP-CTERM system associated)
MATQLAPEYAKYLQASPAVREPVARLYREPASEPAEELAPGGAPAVVLSFYVEEHHRIEAAAGLEIDPGLKLHYSIRAEASTRRLLDLLAERDIRATFFVVGEMAQLNPSLIRAIHRAGHEVASHSWDHRRIHHHPTPAAFAEDLRKSRDALEQVTSQPVRGYRAPTFSVVRQTSWAIDVLAEQGFLYDSSVFPVRHDRYGVPRAPRVPFLARGREHTLLELPPATLRLLGANWPVGGGGYFRLFPLFLMEMALRQLRKRTFPQVATLYFHPWEFDPDQARLPLRRLNGFRTYVGLLGSGDKLNRLLRRHNFTTAIDVAHRLAQGRHQLQTFALDPSGTIPHRPPVSEVRPVPLTTV